MPVAWGKPLSERENGPFVLFRPHCVLPYTHAISPLLCRQVSGRTAGAGLESGGAWPAWFPFLVFASFFLDATVTLLRRMINGEPFWRAHTEHYYQRLIRSGWSHPRTAMREYLVMTASASLATAMLTWSVSAQYAGMVTVAGMFVGLAILVDRRWLQFQQETGKASQRWPRLQYALIPALLAGVAVFAVIPLRDASRYPYIIMEAPDGLRATFLHRGRPENDQCKADVARFVAAI